MKQKDSLGQDMFLIGDKLSGAMRRWLALRFCESVGREAEYVALTRDTSESDLKQRREIVEGGTAEFFDQVRRLNKYSLRSTLCLFARLNCFALGQLFACLSQLSHAVLFDHQGVVNAALYGRVLILEGLEKVERNVLPMINNLLENREMALEDGRFLVAPPQAKAPSLIALQANSKQLSLNRSLNNKTPSLAGPQLKTGPVKTEEAGGREDSTTPSPTTSTLVAVHPGFR
jgi:hypothetical protein